MASFEIFPVVLLRIQTFWRLTLCRYVSVFRRFGETYYLTYIFTSQKIQEFVFFKAIRFAKIEVQCMALRVIT